MRGITAGPVACKGRVAATVFGWPRVRVSVDARTLKSQFFKKVVDNVLFIMYEGMLLECTHYEAAIRCALLY